MFIYSVYSALIIIKSCGTVGIVGTVLVTSYTVTKKLFVVLLYKSSTIMLIVDVPVLTPIGLINNTILVPPLLFNGILWSIRDGLDDLVKTINSFTGVST